MLGKFVRIIALVNHPLDSSVDDHLRARIAGLAGDVHGCAFARDSDHCRLQQRVLLCMKRSDAVARPHAPGWPVFVRAIRRTMRQSSRRSVVSGREYAAISHDQRAHFSALTRGPCRHKVCDLQEVRIPTRTRVHRAKLCRKKRCPRIPRIRGHRVSDVSDQRPRKFLMMLISTSSTRLSRFMSRILYQPFGIVPSSYAAWSQRSSIIAQSLSVSSPSKFTSPLM